MCGIVGIAGVMPVNQSIYDALTVLQHRGQDAAGIITIDANNCFRLRKANGLVSDVFEARHMQRLQGNMGIGHVRYPTAGSSSASEAQPFYVNSPYGITLAHNGNLTNVGSNPDFLRSLAFHPLYFHTPFGKRRLSETFISGSLCFYSNTCITMNKIFYSTFVSK